MMVKSSGELCFGLGTELMSDFTTVALELLEPMTLIMIPR